MNHVLPFMNHVPPFVNNTLPLKSGPCTTSLKQLHDYRPFILQMDSAVASF